MAGEPNETHWEQLGRPWWVTWVAGMSHVPPVLGHVIAESEVARTAQSWIAAGAILTWDGAIPAQGLMSLIGSTWGALGGSRAWRGRDTCPWGVVT